MLEMEKNIYITQGLLELSSLLSSATVGFLRLPRKISTSRIVQAQPRNLI